jgi:vacuolar-type H+-ATPase subunit H
MTPEDYCREVEAYLCRKNEGHLIRIVGPAFEQVCGWATQGVPLKIAFRGIDQYCERYYAKGPRRRPVRIEFCEADILDLFDNWRRAVGVMTEAPDGVEESAPRKPALAGHIDRVVARLTSVRGGGRRSAVFGERIDAAVRELDRLAADARTVRGEARAAVIDRLRGLDDELITAAEGEIDAEAGTRLRAEAEAELLPFAQRMPSDALERARHAAFTRLLRESMGLPVLAYE